MTESHALPRLAGPPTEPGGAEALAPASPVRAGVPILLGALVGALVAGRLETAALCLAVALATATACGARLPAPRWLATLATSATLAWALNLYLVPGEPLAPLPRLLGRAPTREGLMLGGLLTLRMLGAFAAMQGLRAAWTGEQAADAATRALAPLRRVGVPIGELRLMIGLALRFAPLLSAEAERIGRVQALRAGGPPRGWRQRLERRRAAAVPTFVAALERAERVALALEARHVRLRPAAPAGRFRFGPAAAAGIGLAALALLWRG
jgi:energy-coupling factor transport system permease protein